MISKPTLRAIVGALACVLCGAVAAQVRYEAHERGGPSHEGIGRGGGGVEERGGPSMSRAPFERGEPGMGRGVYERGGPPLGRPVGPPEGFTYAPPPPRYISPPPRYVSPPPRYVSPPPRRPYEAPPGWRAAPRQPPGIEGPRPSAGMEGPRMASLGFVIESIKRRSPGRQLDADVDFMDGRPVYRVRWLTVHGRRMDYLVDAETGVILSGR
ncbi:MAG: Propeptide PepSY amd peptidase [Caulobacteraceae bacterium]|nr:Propeptide PepSY amd peptidase [Caulobacteraceae bacterium]